MTLIDRCFLQELKLEKLNKIYLGNNVKTEDNNHC